MAATTRFFVERGVPVCGHIGLTPQAVHALGGYRMQGRDDGSAARVIDGARAQEDAGAALLVVEAVPATLGAEVTATVVIPTNGIGAGPDCSGQVLVLHDILDIAPGRKARFVRNFITDAPSIAAALAAFVTTVRDGSYPAPEHCY
jgi:3-methyl-2-oxobutanoate hydroxymethyltransferase